MAAFTSKASGNWSSGSQTTWNEVGVPGNGDTVTIGTGHAITVDANTTVGHSPAAGDGTAAILVNTTGTLTIAAGITLTCRGDLKLNNTTLTLAAGAVLEFDASQAGTPSTALYVLGIGTANSQTSAKLIVNGTVGSRCAVRSNAGGANARVTDGGFIVGGKVEATYCDFTRLGDASNDSFKMWLTSTAIFSLQNCILDACGRIFGTVTVEATATFRLTNVTTKNGVATVALRIAFTSTLSTGVRLIDECVFDKQVEFIPPSELTLTDTYFHERVSITNGGFAVGTRNFFREATATGHSLPSIDTCYILADIAGSNPHLLNLNQNRDYVIDGCIFEYTGTDANGDCILPTNPANPRTFTIKHCLFLPNAGGECSGTPFSLLGGANVTLNFLHNTYLPGSQAAVIGESYAGHAGMLGEFKHNLAWDTSARGYKLEDISSTVTDVIAAANADRNAGYNLLAGSNGKGYHNLDFSSGSPGATDVDGTDPDFVDETRDLAAWDASLGGAGTVANALTELRKRNDAAGYNPAYTIAALITWVKAGFEPRATALHVATDHVEPSYGWIGAVRGILRGEVFSAGPQVVLHGAYLDIQAPEGHVAVVKNLYLPPHGTGYEVEWFDGSTAQTIGTATGSQYVTAYKVGNTRRLRVKNLTGSAQNLGYDGYYIQ